MAEVLRREPYGRGTRPVIKCTCGREVLCAEFTNTCECGIDYNMSGQMLAPRSQWGEETGERPEDCVGPFDGDDLDSRDW